MKERFKRAMMSLGDAVQFAVSSAATGAASHHPADVADNPGGGGRGNTTYLLRALKGARAQQCCFGVFNDAAVAAKAHELGEAPSSPASSLAGAPGFSCRRLRRPRWSAVGWPLMSRRGDEERSSDMALSALLDLAASQLVVTPPLPCMDPRPVRDVRRHLAAGRASLNTPNNTCCARAPFQRRNR